MKGNWYCHPAPVRPSISPPVYYDNCCRYGCDGVLKPWIKVLLNIEIESTAKSVVQHKKKILFFNILLAMGTFTKKPGKVVQWLRLYSTVHLLYLWSVTTLTSVYVLITHVELTIIRVVHWCTARLVIWGCLLFAKFNLVLVLIFINIMT